MKRMLVALIVAALVGGAWRGDETKKSAREGR